MGESFALATHNEAPHTSLPQPVVSVLGEDDDEPPSRGSHHERSTEMKSMDCNFPHSTIAQVVSVEVHSKDFSTRQTGCVVNERVITTTGSTFDHGPVASQVDVEKHEPITEPNRRKRYRILRASRSDRLRALFTPRVPVGPNPTYRQSLVNCVKYSPLNILLVFIPVSWALHFTHQSATLVFILSGLGIVPLAALLGFGTEQIALRTSQSVGGLLNASLGNLIEMIISGIALQKCELEVVQSALLGGLLSNLLLVLGCAFLVGGFRFHQQEFQPMVAQLNSSLLIVSVISLTIPAAFHQYLESRLPQGSEANILVNLSRVSAIILMLIYVAYLVFQFYSHNHLFLDTIQEYDSSTRSPSPSSSMNRRSTETLPLPASAERSTELYRSETVTTHLTSSTHDERARLNTPSALILLAIVTALAYVTAEHLVDSLHGLIDSHPSISKEWITLIVIPIIGNAAEHTTAVIVASKGKFDLAMSVAVGSCIQIALFVIPVLVCVAWGMGKPLTLLFDPLETIVLFLSVLVVKFSVEDGKSHWMSGIVLVSTYVLIAVSFWYFPNNLARTIQGQSLQCVS
ncbi:Sodium/calcium exchanger protein-domain-containing protein [Crepidotus variabilis]|uniref:Vacuolar calcium ion transporter n=1 Tax=Crepidotus variabilis TaxID=179855 RepID=A0A9P6ELW4_9AGAR|nr:Sodium/calcium exchanger protein-domain-containing protein [Crepidotus variabilis]